MKRLKALIFDVDGTLADTEKDGHRVAFNCAFAEAGLDWNWSPEIYGELLSVTGGKERIKFYLEQYLPDFKIPSGDFIPNLHAEKTKHYKNVLGEGKIPLRPGVKRLITEAREAGVRLAIATTTTPQNVTALLEHYLDSSWFEIIAAGDIVPAKKPAPDIYDYVLQEMKLEPQDCLAFEDSHHGLRSATLAGIKTIVTVNEYTQNQDFSEALIVLDSLGEPEAPFQALAGNPENLTYVDMALLHRLFKQESQA